MKDWRILGKFFILIFSIIFLVLNWQRVVLIFNYQVLREKFSFFQEKKIKDKREGFLENKLHIPKLSLEAPIISQKKKTSKKELEKLLKKGVLLYPELALPGEQGTAIILGHSAPPSWPEINFDNIFNDLTQLEFGDEIFVYFNQKKFIYQVFDQKIFLPKEEEKFLSKDNKEEPLLILLTCWPPGKNFKRLAVISRLVNN